MTLTRDCVSKISLSLHFLYTLMDITQYLQYVIPRRTYHGLLPTFIIKIIPLH